MALPEYVVIPYLMGADGEASVEINNLTVRVDQQSRLRFINPEFGAWLLDQIYEKHKILAIRRGLLRKTWTCPECDAELLPESAKPMSIEVKLETSGFVALVVTIRLPSVECPNCRRICGMDKKGSLPYHVNEAIVRALEGGKIKA
jgi:hypothetical protein